MYAALWFARLQPPTWKKTNLYMREQPGKKITHTVRYWRRNQICSEKGLHIFSSCGSKFTNSYIGKARAMKNGHGARCVSHTTPLWGAVPYIWPLSNRTHIWKLRTHIYSGRKSPENQWYGSSTFSACSINPANFIVNPTKSALPLASVSHAAPRLSLPELLFSTQVWLSRARLALFMCRPPPYSWSLRR